MYNSVREMHIAIDHGLQHISSNRKQSINSYLKDLALNYSVLQFIELRSSGKTIDGKGFEDSQKRYDDLKELKRTTGIIPTYKQEGIDQVFVIQPNDYYKLIGSTSRVIYNKFKEPHEYNNETIKYKVLEFPTDYSSPHESYSEFKIIRRTISTSAEEDVVNILNYPKFKSTFKHDAKFMYVNLVLNKTKIFHWERWDDAILYDRFIIIDDDDDIEYELIYKTTEATPAFITRTSSNQTINVKEFAEPYLFVIETEPTDILEVGDIITGQTSSATSEVIRVISGTRYIIKDIEGTYSDNEVIGVTGVANKLIASGVGYPNITLNVEYKKKRNELLSSLYFENIEENVQYSRNRHRKPISKLHQNRLIIEQGSTFLVPFVDIEYIAKPTLIDHVTGKTCEISITREIIDLTIQRLKAYIKDEGYQQIVHETQISE